MGIFKKKADGPKISKEVANLPWVRNPATIDPTFGDPLSRELTQAMETGDYQTASRLLHGATPLQRAFAIASSDDDPTRAVETTRRWMAEWPQDPMGLLVGGVFQTLWAWHARGSGWSDTVSEQGWQQFFDRLQESDQLLRQAARAMPADPLPWAWMITTGRGLQMPVEETSARFDEAHRRHPWHPGATSAMLQNLCAKWNGSHQQMFDFARFAAAECPEGSPAASALPMAYIEEAIHEARDIGLETAIGRMATPNTVNALAAAAERSIFHPNFVAEGSGLSAANVFLAAFFWCDAYVLTDRTLRVLQGRYSDHPFSYIGDAGRMCRKVEYLTARHLSKASLGLH